MGHPLDIGEEVEEGDHEEGNGIAHKEPCRGGLNLRDNPIRMRDEEQDHHQCTQADHCTDEFERLFPIAQ